MSRTNPSTRRRLCGLTFCDEENVAEGLALITGSWGGTTARLVNEAGQVVHSWELPWHPGLGQTITDRGTLLANGKIADSHPFLGGLPFQGGAVAEFTFSGEKLWEIRHSGHHHDSILLKNGNVLLLGTDEVPADLASRVAGGIGDPQEPMCADSLLEYTTTGELVWEWHGYEHLDPALDQLGPGPMSRSEWTHGNGLAELPDGDILLSARQLSTVLRISRETGEITRRYGAGSLAGQHSPWLTGEGTVLVFDNGFNRQDGHPPHSRLVEFDLDTGEEVWSYSDPVPWEMFSALQSSVQRLPNGNTFVCEGLTGRVFEVTHAGGLVWEYHNPNFTLRAGAETGIRSNRMFRARKFSRALFPELAEAGGTTETDNTGASLPPATAPLAGRNSAEFIRTRKEDTE